MCINVVTLFGNCIFFIQYPENIKCYATFSNMFVIYNFMCLHTLWRRVDLRVVEDEK
jgi:hypothetical protein